MGFAEYLVDVCGRLRVLGRSCLRPGGGACALQSILVELFHDLLVGGYQTREGLHPEVASGDELCMIEFFRAEVGTISPRFV